MHIKFNSTPTPNIHFGQGKIKSLPKLILGFGNRVLLITGKSSFLKSFTAIDLFQDLEFMNIIVEIETIGSEPTPLDIDAIVRRNIDFQPSVVVAIGGGSVIDAGKAVSAMLCETGTITDYLEDVGTKVPSGLKVPFIAVPTTSGTGSEATKNAVITLPGKDGFKKSLRHDNYIPNLALIDPMLTLNCPAKITAASGMDAFTQLLESYLSTNSNPYTDALAFEGLAKLLDAIEGAVETGNNIEFRTKMSYAAMLSGITLANAGLGVVHGFAQPLGSLFGLPHGVVCGTLMGAANRISVFHLREQDEHNTLQKYYRLAMLITPDDNETKAIDRLLDYIDGLIIKFQLPRLSEFGVTENDLPLIVSKSSLKYHPVNLSNNDMEWILKQRL